MRLWSLHPEYLDAKGLVALWREALLARAVLRGQTRGYNHHPQLERFRSHVSPRLAINAYLAAVHAEASSRGYAFDRRKIGPIRPEATEANVRIAEIFGGNPEAMRHAMAAMERHANERRPVPVPTDLGETYGSRFIQAAMLAMMGQPDSAMAMLERVHEEEGDFGLRNAGLEPMLAPLHDDPRFVALLEKIGLVPVESARAWMKDR